MSKLQAYMQRVQDALAQERRACEQPAKERSRDGCMIRFYSVRDGRFLLRCRECGIDDWKQFDDKE